MTTRRIIYFLFLLPLLAWPIFLYATKYCAYDGPNRNFTGEMNVSMPNFVEKTFHFPSQAGFPSESRDIRFRYSQERGGGASLQWVYRISPSDFQQVAKRYNWKLQRTKPVGAYGAKLLFLTVKSESENCYYYYEPKDWEYSLYLVYDCDTELLYGVYQQLR